MGFSPMTACLFRYTRTSLLEPGAAQAKPNNALQVQLQGRLPTLHYVSRLLGRAHKTWPLGLTFVAILGEFSESEVRPVGFVLFLPRSTRQVSSSELG
jgi:hypothetical protein